MARLAAIDVGTNSVRTTVVEVAPGEPYPPKPHPEDAGNSAERHAAPGGFSQIVRDEHAARRVSGRPTDADG